VVEDTKSWHEHNLQRNWSHYTPLFPLKHLPVACIASLTDDFGASVWFNVDVSMPVNGVMRKVKYGVISKKQLIRDLEEWEYLYIAGRLHKPVLKLIDNTVIESAMRLLKGLLPL
jgi:translocator assembly and maintenance protein 41